MHAFWLNGIVVDGKDINPLGLLRLLKKERTTVSALTELGLNRQQAFELLTHPNVVQSQGASNVLDGIFDASDRPEGGDLIVWWNDMEKDSRYGFCLSFDRFS
jgi:UDP-glucose:glycoprotein glucosyltransferase